MSAGLHQPGRKRPNSSQHSDRLPRPEAARFLVDQPLQSRSGEFGPLGRRVTWSTPGGVTGRTVELRLTSDTGTLDGAELSGAALIFSEAIDADAVESVKCSSATVAAAHISGAAAELARTLHDPPTRQLRSTTCSCSTRSRLLEVRAAVAHAQRQQGRASHLPVQNYGGLSRAGSRCVNRNAVSRRRTLPVNHDFNKVLFNSVWN